MEAPPPPFYITFERIFFNMDIYLDKRYINMDIEYEGMALSDDAVVVYTALRIDYTQSKNNYLVTPDSLWFALSGRAEPSVKYKNRLEKGLQELIDKELVSVIWTGKRKWILSLSSLFIDIKNDYFIILKDSEINTIFNYNESKIDKFKLLRLFAAMIGTFDIRSTHILDEDKNINNFCGYMPMSVLGKLSNITNETTLINYQSWFEEQGLLYIYRHNEVKINKATGEVIRFPNHYGRPENSHEIKQVCLQKVSDISIGNRYNMIPNNGTDGRRYSQIYNWLRKGKEYSKEEICSTYEFLYKRNVYTNRHIASNAERNGLITANSDNIKDLSWMEEKWGYLKVLKDKIDRELNEK